MLNNWTVLTLNKKISFYLGLSESVIQSLSDSEFFEDARRALDICWEWFETKVPTGDEIYTFLDNGTEFGGLFIQMQMDENEENEAKWDCIIDAVSYVNRQAYSFEDVKYLPAPIENVNDDLINHFLEGFYSINTGNKQIADRFLDYVKDTDIKSKADVIAYFS